MYYFSLLHHDLFRVVSCCFVFTARELSSRPVNSVHGAPRPGGRFVFTLVCLLRSIIIFRGRAFLVKTPKNHPFMTVFRVPPATKGTIDKITENPHCKEGTRFSLHSKVGECSRGQPALHNLRRRALPLSQPENSEQRKIRQRRKRQRRGKRTTPKRTADPPPSPLSV